MSGQRILLGKVLRPHGLRGLIVVQSYAQSETSFLEAQEVLLRPVSGRDRQFPVLSATPHKNRVLMKLAGLNSLEEAEPFRNAEILVSADAISREEGEFFWHELIGLRVFLDTGTYVGDISRIISAGGNDVYVVACEKNEIFVPATYEVVKAIDLENGCMTISAMEGLLELNEV